MAKDLKETKKWSPGFTLIETLMYIIFLCLILSAMLGIVYQTLQATDQINKKIILQTEADFLLAKISWMLSGDSAIIYPAVNGSGSELVVNKFGFGQNPLTLTRQNGFLQLARAADDDVNLNSQNVTAGNFTVLSSQVPGEPEEVEVDFFLENAGSPASRQNFQLIKYLR